MVRPAGTVGYLARENDMKKALISFCFAGLLALGGVGVVDTPKAEASYVQYGRQYYGNWSYNEINSYHYRHYYYKPVVTAPTYSYHYVIHYPAQPRYYYYYNPVKRHYWGRFDTQEKGYSLLAEADRKEKLEDIKESAFPKPAAMPNVPDTEDKLAIDTPPDDAPKAKDKK